MKRPAAHVQRTEAGDIPFKLSHALPWLQDYAFDVWSNAGRDPNGGFFERLDLSGQPTADARRVRVQARQIFCFAQAGDLGWQGDWQTQVNHGLDYIARHGLDDRGYLRGLIDVDGRPVETPPDLYDQAFYLLALAHSYRVTGAPKYRRLALDLLQNLRRDFSHPLGGFLDTPVNRDRLRANPHMHLLEAALAWVEISDADAWRELATEIAELCQNRLIDRRIGALLEYFNADWSPIDVGSLAYIEPGHQFEWCWLLTRYEALVGEVDASVYRTLFEIGEQHGVCPQRGVAIDELRRDLTWKQGQARLWPQTERLKAAVALAQMSTGADRNIHLAQAREAVAGLGLYFTGVPKGLWRDKLLQDGSFVDEPVPASSFYHIVHAIAELSRSDLDVARQGTEAKAPLKLVEPAFR
ncbi:AGE family epimerase/isomerase [Methylocella sp. CPCC 101449]|uniref:AGE family epimerase/isomerase n=1 Tax=Methylocella sp. CPCC 101449 TaxID=2987531 RepID=UPI00288DD934|nr:AGE family epimerase/isomerase [Methylocella sp. CPCC 101449]MDT2022866.1 AGE family epimerase/isomerase [Methylocella sp. CPCC 101449]